MPIVNGKWVNPLDPSNYSFGPGGGQGLFNPGHQQVYWQGGAPSFQAPKQSIGPIGQQQTTYGPTAPGWIGGGAQQNFGGQQYNPLPVYNAPTQPLPTNGGYGGGPQSILNSANPSFWSLFNTATGYTGSAADQQTLQNYENQVNQPVQSQNFLNYNNTYVPQPTQQPQQSSPLSYGYNPLPNYNFNQFQYGSPSGGTGQFYYPYS